MTFLYAVNRDRKWPFRCTCCRIGDGWGPMLRTHVWNEIVPKRASWNTFLCERCMKRLLGRPITGRMLRDCPMNSGHAAYRPHGFDDVVWWYRLNRRLA